MTPAIPAIAKGTVQPFTAVDLLVVPGVTVIVDCLALTGANTLYWNGATLTVDASALTGTNTFTWNSSAFHF